MVRLLAILASIEKVITDLGVATGWILLLPIICFRFFDIVAKQFFDPPSGLVQLFEFDGFFIMVCLLFGFAYLRDAHARIDVLRERFSRRAKAWMEIAGILFALIPFCVLMIAFGTEYVANTFDDHDRWWVPGLDLWVKKVFVPFGLGLLLLSGLIVLARNTIFLATGEGGPAPGGAEPRSRAGEVR